MGDRVYRRRKDVVLASTLLADGPVSVDGTTTVQGKTGQVVVDDGVTRRVMDADDFNALYVLVGKS